MWHAGEDMRWYCLSCWSDWLRYSEPETIAYLDLHDEWLRARRSPPWLMDGRTRGQLRRWYRCDLCGYIASEQSVEDGYQAGRFLHGSGNVHIRRDPDATLPLDADMLSLWACGEWNAEWR